MKKFSLLILFLLLFISTIVSTAGANDNHSAGKRSLQGEWELYWQKLYTPEDFQGGHRPTLTPVTVPSPWYSAVRRKELSEFGYATYRLTFSIPPEHVGKSKTLYLGNIASAYQIWIDGQNLGGVGEVGKTREEEKPMIYPQFVFFEPKQEVVELIIQVSNFSFREGGILGNIFYGDPNDFSSSFAKQQFIDIFMIGGFFFIGMYHLIIYGMRKQDLSSLLLGLGGLVGAIRTAIVSNQWVVLQVSDFNWSVLTRVEYLVEMIGFYLIILYMKTMYPNEIHKLPLRVSYIVAIVCSCYIFFTPTYIFTKTLLLQVSIIAVVLSYFIGYVGIMAAIRRREGAFVNLLGLFIILIAILNDTIYYTYQVNTLEVFEYSILFFLLLQAVIVSYRYSLLFGKNKSLTEELVSINNTLEEKVVSRTKEIHERNEELFQLANYDSLTGLYNRRYFIQQVKERLEDAECVLAFLVIDIDNFKSINDRFGHLVGDQVLMEFSSVLKNRIGELGLVGRVGGEEFAICLDGSSKEESILLANQLRLTIESHPILLANDDRLTVTFSCGITYTDEKGVTFEELYQAADRALYVSKETGKNKVTVSS
jgi:diguanylate cyclase (GGDEF)-like protein